MDIGKDLSPWSKWSTISKKQISQHTKVWRRDDKCKRRWVTSHGNPIFGSGLNNGWVAAREVLFIWIVLTFEEHIVMFKQVNACNERGPSCILENDGSQATLQFRFSDIASMD